MANNSHPIFYFPFHSFISLGAATLHVIVTIFYPFKRKFLFKKIECVNDFLLVVVEFLLLGFQWVFMMHLT